MIWFQVKLQVFQVVAEVVEGIDSDCVTQTQRTGPDVIE